MDYPIHVFIEILDSLPQIKFLRRESYDGISANVYEGMRGNAVIIDTTDEDIDEQVAKGHLFELGVADLIPALFPTVVN